MLLKTVGERKANMTQVSMQHRESMPECAIPLPETETAEREMGGKFAGNDAQGNILARFRKSGDGASSGKTSPEEAGMFRK